MQLDRTEVHSIASHPHGGLFNPTNAQSHPSNAVHPLQRGHIALEAEEPRLRRPELSAIYGPHQVGGDEEHAAKVEDEEAAKCGISRVAFDRTHGYADNEGKYI